MKDLINFKKNVYSQYGEDGIIKEILYRLKDFTDNQYCEFGAWDGIHLSNVYSLIKNTNFKALLIEPDKKKFIELCKNNPSPSIIKLNTFVGLEEKNKIDTLLKQNNFNINFDFLSIDVDSIDYYIFESLDIYKPKLICIEYNPTIPNDVDFVQKEYSSNQGASALSLIKLAKSKSYYPVCTTETNIFFIHVNYKKQVIGDKDLKINDLINDTKIKNYIFYGYDGSIFTSKEVRLPWHNIVVKDLNVLKWFLKKYPRNYNFLERFLFKIYRKFNNYF
jgi:hypothetical protein